MPAEATTLLGGYFTEPNLKRVFEEKLQFQSAVGTDGITTARFSEIANREIAIALRKIHSATYSFTRYREKLISKGARKYPREIAIPSVRDKLVLRVLTEALSSKFSNCHPPPINQTVARLRDALNGGSFSGFLRLDIKDFYPSVRHDKLFPVIEETINEPEILHLIKACIRRSSNTRSNIIGVPQGLPVSNILANIYLLKVDEFVSHKAGILYSRFVDDILILGDFDSLPQLHEQIKELFSMLGLSAHELGTGKSDLKRIGEPVSFLGYQFSQQKVSVRNASVQKLKESLIGIVVAQLKQKRRNYRARLFWRLNLRVTGCVVNNQRFGWLFFFSEIDDISLLKSLDVFVDRLLSRWKIRPRGMKVRKFLRAYFEIKFRSETTAYIPSFDGFGKSEKIETLKRVYGVKVKRDWSDSRINREFFSRLKRETLSLEEDLVRIS